MAFDSSLSAILRSFADASEGLKEQVSSISGGLTKNLTGISDDASKQLGGVSETVGQQLKGFSDATGDALQVLHGEYPNNPAATRLLLKQKNKNHPVAAKVSVTDSTA